MSRPSLQLPTERDLPPGRPGLLRAAILRHAAGQQRHGRHHPWLAPAATVAAVLAVAVTAALLARTGPTRHTPAGGPTSTQLDDASVARRCVSVLGGQVLVQLTDRLGGYAVVYKDGTVRACDVMPVQGLVVSAPVTEWRPAQHLNPAGGLYVLRWPDGGSYFTPDLPAGTPPTSSSTAVVLPRPLTGYGVIDVFGCIDHRVDRVTVAVPGLAPVGAVLNGPYFAARILQRTDSRTAAPQVTVTAYDAAGNVVARITQPG